MQANFKAAQLVEAHALIYSNSKWGRWGGEKRLKGIFFFFERIKNPNELMLNVFFFFLVFNTYNLVKLWAG